MIRTTVVLSMLIVPTWVLPAAAQSATPVAPPTATAREPTKQCLTARKREDKEQRALAAAIDAIAKDAKGRESCSSKSMCARYDAAISDMEKRKVRHETRLAKFKEDVDNDCKAP